CADLRSMSYTMSTCDILFRSRFFSGPDDFRRRMALSCASSAISKAFSTAFSISLVFLSASFFSMASPSVDKEENAMPEYVCQQINDLPYSNVQTPGLAAACCRELTASCCMPPYQHRGTV